MFEVRLGEINYLAVLASGLATFLLGGIWYTALFGRRWLELQRITGERAKEMQARRPPPLFFGGMTASYSVLALAIALLFGALGVYLIDVSFQFLYLILMGAILGGWR